MNIVHVVESFSGGTFDFLADLTTALSQHRHIVIHGVRDNTPANFQELFPAGTLFYKWEYVGRSINPRKDLLAQIELLKLLRRIDNKDILHLHSSKAGFLGRIAARIIGLHKRTIYTSHGAAFLRKDISAVQEKIFLLLEKVADLFAGKVIACSESEANEFRKKGLEATCISNGTKLLVNRNINKIETQITIGTLGSITAAKNPLLFNKIANKFIGNDKVAFIWIGDGQDRDILTAANITVTGWVDKSAVADKLSAIDIYLSTSAWEGLPLSVIQAMSLTKPLVLSACVGNRDLVIPGQNGYLYTSLNEAITYLNTLIHDKDDRQQLGEKSYKFAKEYYTVERMANDYATLYEAIYHNISLQ